jgi:hypothetical protein
MRMLNWANIESRSMIILELLARLPPDQCEDELDGETYPRNTFSSAVLATLNWP